MDNKKIFSFIILSLLFSTSSFARHKVFYLPLEVETFVPVTKDNIEDQAELQYETSSKTFEKAFAVQKYVIKKVTTNLTNVRGKFLQLKGKKVIYLDQSRRLYDENGELLVDKDVLGQLLFEIESKYKELCSLKKLPPNTKAACSNREK